MQWEQSLRLEVSQALQKILFEVFPETFVVATDADKITVLFATNIENHLSDYKYTAIEIATRMKNYVFVETGYTTTIGIGRYYEDVRNLHISYQEAFTAQENGFFTGRNSIIHFDNVTHSVNNTNAILNCDITNTTNKLILGDIEGVKREFYMLKTCLFSDIQISPQYFKIQVSTIVIGLARAALQGGANLKDVFTIQENVNSDLKMMENVEEISEWLDGIVEVLIELILECQSGKKSGAIQKAIKYIDQRYNQAITLEEVSEYVNLTSNYFSNTFKKATGKSFIEYIASIRIQNAKVLLMDLNYTVYQVALEVGYSDSRYFSRVFKNSVGKTPSLYRNSMLENGYYKNMI